MDGGGVRKKIKIEYLEAGEGNGWHEVEIARLFDSDFVNKNIISITTDKPKEVFNEILQYANDTYSRTEKSKDEKRVYFATGGWSENEFMVNYLCKINSGALLSYLGRGGGYFFDLERDFGSHQEMRKIFLEDTTRDK